MRVPVSTTNVRLPKRRRTSRRTLVLLILTIVLPPLGLLLLWRIGNCPLRGKVLISLLGVAVMILACMLYIGGQQKVGEDVPLTYQYPSLTAAPTQAPRQDVVVPPPSPDSIGEDGGAASGEQTGGDDALPDGVIPANPAG
jgi:hypothetical protein